MILSKSLTIIYLTSLLDLFAVGLTVPLISSHLLSVGASRTTVGLAQSTYSLLQIFWGPVFGSLSDAFGRKFILVLVTSSCSLLYFLLGFCNSVLLFFLVRIALGSIKHTQTLCKAVIADIIPKEKQTEVLGFCNGLSSLGFVLGPLIGGYLFEYTHGFYMVCCLTSLAFLCNCGLVANLPEESDNKKDKENPTNGAELFQAITNMKTIPWKEYWDAFLLRLLYALSASTYFSNQGLYIQEKFSLSQRHVGFTISFFGTVSLISSLFMGLLTKKFYPKDPDYYKQQLHAYSLMTVSLLGLYLAPNVYWFCFLLLPFSMVSTALRIISMELLLNRSKKEDNTRGCLVGASNSVMSFARLLTPITSGVVADAFGDDATILMSAVPALSATLLTATLYGRKVTDKNKDL
ncbi:major facilitator superfamily domain-containing protein 9 [Agrilus planipennis]|uniref:Major facilitator superfamily domain-containing protein 9 n=1 Tax=Agrilus planipennis TaxID=224129 RepID=A0A1W4XAB0_AGRPL|nr:major facilitator superfamily domain-containing protein 9 [Agrilus planipennis]